MFCRGQEKQAAGQLGLSRYGPQVMSVLCLCTTVHQTGQNNNQASKILPNTSPISSEEESINSLQEIPTDELALLAKLEEANRWIVVYWLIFIIIDIACAIKLCFRYYIYIAALCSIIYINSWFNIIIRSNDCEWEKE